jgi:hypothetical protein
MNPVVTVLVALAVLWLFIVLFAHLPLWLLALCLIVLLAFLF